MKIYSLTFHVLHVSAKTNWSFVRVEIDSGVVGWGECSLNGWETLQREYCLRFAAELIGKRVISVADAEAACALHLHSSGGLIEHSVESATEHALLDALGQHQGVPVWQLFGDAQRSSVEVYANINRATQPIKLHWLECPRTTMCSARRTTQHNPTRPAQSGMLQVCTRASQVPGAIFWNYRWARANSSGALFMAQCPVSQLVGTTCRCSPALVQR